MKPFEIKALAWGVSLALALALRGVKRKSLSRSGAVAAFAVGLCSIASGWRSGLLLILFYQAGSMATKHRKPLKEKMDATAVTASARGASQVLGCSFFATICAIIHSFRCGEEQRIHFAFDDNINGEDTVDGLLCPKLACAIVAHYACCCADTFASELGMLSLAPPRLITAPWREVPRGTNGGVSLWGTFCSLLGGSLMGFVCFCVDMASAPATSFIESTTLQYLFQCLVFGGICGVVGSFLDSFFGATCQASYYDKDTRLVYSAQDHDVPVPSSAHHICGFNIMSNVQVNVVSTILTMIVGAHLIGPATFVA